MSRKDKDNGIEKRMRERESIKGFTTVIKSTSSTLESARFLAPSLKKKFAQLCKSLSEWPARLLEDQ